MNILSSQDVDADIIIPSATLSWTIGGIAKQDSYSNVLLESVSISDAEVVDIRKCFDDVTHIFAFGRNTERSLISVRLILFLGVACTSASGAKATLKKLTDAYASARIYASSSPVSVTIGGDDTGGSYSGFLYSMDVSPHNPAWHSCTVTFTFIRDEGR